MVPLRLARLVWPLAAMLFVWLTCCAVGAACATGGYNTLRHGSQSGGAIDSIQAELANVGLRDTQENRAKFAKAYCSCLVAFLKRHYFPDSDVFAERGSKWKVDD